MRESFVLTVIGNDRPGLVEALSHTLAAHGANWEASRMARLGGQFAGILLVTAPTESVGRLLSALPQLEGRGLRVEARPAAAPEPAAGARVLALDVVGADRPGIVRDISSLLAEASINVEDLESEVTSAPMSGEPLFHARARLACPPALPVGEVRARLEALANEIMVELKVETE